MFRVSCLTFQRPSHRDVFEHRHDWANSRELQPPRSGIEELGKVARATPLSAKFGIEGYLSKAARSWLSEPDAMRVADRAVNDDR